MAKVLEGSPLLLDNYAIKYLARKLEGATPEQIAHFYITKFIMNGDNGQYLQHLIAKYKLPKNDLLKMHQKIEQIAKKGVT